MTPSGIEQGAFRFVAQDLNNCATAVAKTTKLSKSLRYATPPINKKKSIPQLLTQQLRKRIVCFDELSSQLPNSTAYSNSPLANT